MARHSVDISEVLVPVQNSHALARLWSWRMMVRGFGTVLEHTVQCCALHLRALAVLCDSSLICTLESNSPTHILNCLYFTLHRSKVKIQYHLLVETLLALMVF